jgi:hypothetical protein
MPDQEKEAGEVKAYTLECTVDIPDPFAKLSDEELSKELEIGRARFVYAHEQSQYWQTQVYTRTQRFNQLLIAQAKRKHGITEEQMRDNPSFSWVYAK